MLDTAKYRGKVLLTGLGTPDSMKKCVSDATVKAFELWNPANLGYLAGYAAADLASGTLKVSQGTTFKAATGSPHGARAAMNVRHARWRSSPRRPRI